MAPATAMQVSHVTQPGAPARPRDHAVSAPIAPTAPKARYSTPVARYRTTSPTPDRAYTPPRARPLTRNCESSDQLGIYLLSPVGADQPAVRSTSGPAARCRPRSGTA